MQDPQFISALPISLLSFYSRFSTWVLRFTSFLLQQMWPAATAADAFPIDLLLFAATAALLNL